MIGVKVTYEDGNTINTSINGTIEEARAYFVGQEFQFGDTEEHPADRLVKAIAVEEIGATTTAIEVYEPMPVCEGCGKPYTGLNECDFVEFLEGLVDDPICDTCCQEGRGAGTK